MVGITFDRPVGPYADTKELEYVSALHQTCAPLLRQDGSIEAIDILHFLRSRHGVEVEEDVVRQAIIIELCGSPELQARSEETAEDSSDMILKKEAAKDGDEEEEEEDPEPAMDICQMLALLLVPFLRSGNSDGTNQEAVSRVIEIALDTIWAELRAHAVDVQGSDTDEGVLVTPEFLGEILDCFGEFSVSKDVLNEMVQAASGDDNQNNEPQFYLTKASFLQALTADTQMFDPNLDETLNTHFEEAQLAHEKTIASGGKTMQDEYGPEEEPVFKTVYMADNVDSTADSYRSTLWFVLAWVSAVFVYVCYMTNTDIKATKEDFAEWGCDNLFGCDLARALLNWSVIFIELMVLGLLWVFVTTLGNSTHPTKTIPQKLFTTIRILIAMTLTLAGTVLTFFYPIDLGFINSVTIINSDSDDSGNAFYVAAYYICLILGFMMLLCQLFRVLSMYLSIGPFTKGSREYKERRTKRASTAKITKLVEHATLLHVSPDDERKSFASASSVFKSTVSEAVKDVSKKLHESVKSPRQSKLSAGSATSKVLLNFSNMEHTKEETGGVLWTFKKIFDGSLFNEEGIYLHGRLLAVNFAQFLVVGILCGAFALVYVILDYFLARGDDGCDFRIPGLIVEEGTLSNVTSDVDTLEGELIRRLQQSNIFEANSTYNETEDFDGLAELFQGLENATFNNETLASAIEFIEGVVNYVRENAGELAGFPTWTMDDWNINETHFFDGFHLFEGQFPNWTQEIEEWDGRYPVICYDLYSANFTEVWINYEATRNELLEQLQIENWEYRLAASIGLLFAIFAAVTIAMVYVPSFVSSALKFRSGYDQSLKGNQVTFLGYRKSPDQCSILYGSAFWGIFFSSGLAFLIFGALTFILVWPLTHEWVKTIIANFIGIGATITLKVIFMMCVRKSIFAGGFYRKKPATAAITNVFLEAWSLGTSIGTVTTRAITLICVTIFFIGRIDTPLLADGIGYVKGTPVDKPPIAFKKDLLIHEAHRHPYMERLGLLYLLKLHGGKSFGTRAGAYWRLLFTLALLPWMRKYRVSRGVPISDKDDMDDQLSTIGEATDDNEKQAALSHPVSGGDPFAWDETDNIETLAAKRRQLKIKLKALNATLSEKLKDSSSFRAGALDQARLMESQRLDDRPHHLDSSEA
ncbi:expressed unknown protein [Seminavis robusta]|uniref:Uncharacterized protein n=1 Tax=Seminavis robusta TaxID=568900 RepID=A0A9N8ES05_9STRA|nr:expressed unknown protein [Seminavis robusta]|eukprot:Sro1713_g292950.1 n/a (1153) ;mRNA; f:7620-11985